MAVPGTLSVPHRTGPVPGVVPLSGSGPHDQDETGHSLGGSVAPRVAAAELSVARLVILAGGAEPLHRAAVRQFRYLASLEPGGAAAGQAALDAITRQGRAVDDPGLSESTPASELPFGVPARYPRRLPCRGDRRAPPPMGSGHA